MDIKDLDSIWNSAFDKEMKNMYDDSKAASDYDNSINIKNDGIKRAKAFNFPKNYTVLDIGAGPGILALPLSKIVKEVVAVEPSIEMAKHLNKHIEDENIKNIKVINKKWQDVEDFDSEFDAVIASYSLNMKDISEMILKMNKASKKHCYIFWFSGATSWENEQRDIFKILGKDYVPKLNKANIIYEILYQMNLYPDIKVLRDTNFNRNYNDIEDVVKFLKYRYKIESDLYNAELKKYVKNSYPETEKGYAYVDTTKYTEIHWIKE